MLKNNLSLQINILILIISVLLFIPFLGQVHLFDWDEINFAESAREMLLTKDYLNVQINFQPFWEKPPLFIWLQAISMKIFGVNEFAARFPNAVCGIITLQVLFRIGKRVLNQQFAFIWVLSFAGSLLPFFYFKSGIIDPWFNLFIFLGIYFLFNYLEFDLRKKINISLSALFIGLAILTKGPVALLIFGLTCFIYLIIKGFRFNVKISEVFLFLIILVFVGGFWFILQILNGNFNIIHDFIIYQIRLFKTKDAGHGGFLFYHFVILIVGVFPASIFAMKSFKKGYFEESIQNNFKQLMAILFWTVIILFTIVKTKIVHYSSMCYFPLTFLAASVLYKIIHYKEKFNNWLVIGVTGIGIIYVLFISLLSFIEKNKQYLIDKGIFSDPFAIANLMADAGYTGYEYLIGIVLFVAILLFIFFKISQNYKASIISLFVGCLLFIELAVVFITPKIENYTQLAAIEFYKSLKDKDCYVSTLKFKSYAQYFYTEKKKPDNKKSYNTQWLLKGDIDKDVYFVIRNNKMHTFLNKHDDIELLYEKNGYGFLFRKKKEDK